MDLKSLPNFKHERQFWQQGKQLVAGVDEVGRGAWAGPLVTAAAIFRPKVLTDQHCLDKLSTVKDSKQLTPKQRKHLLGFFEELSLRQLLYFGVGSVSAEIIDKHGLSLATGRAMRQALRAVGKKLPTDIEHILVDAFPIRYLPKKKHTPLKKGDELSLSIATASIIAKEHRDRWMKRLAQQRSFAVYGWQTNVGYGTRQHREAIKKHGPSRLHRKLFL